jgi:hypothetical protein
VTGVPRPVGLSRLTASALAHPVRTLLVTYAVTRLIGLGALWAAATFAQNGAGVGHLHPNVWDMFGLWDGTWYQRVVTDGYPVPVPADPGTGRLTYSTWAFYPAFPMLMRGLAALGIPFVLGGVLLNIVLGAVATVLVWAVLREAVHAYGRAPRARLALMGAMLWCLHPATTILMQPYSEALAMVLVGALLLLLLRRQYLAVAVVSLLLGLARGIAPAVGIVILVHLWLRWREDRSAGRAPWAGQRASLAVMLVAGGVSGILWPAIAGWRTGIPTVFFDVQEAWGQRPTEGPFVLWITWAWAAKGLFGLVVLVACIGTYLALVLGRHGRWLSAEVRVWAVAYPLYLFAVVRPITSMWRFLLLDFPVMALVASVAMRTSIGGDIVVHWRRRVALLLLPMLAGVVWWTCTIWPFTPWASRPP